MRTWCFLGSLPLLFLLACDTQPATDARATGAALSTEEYNRVQQYMPSTGTDSLPPCIDLTEWCPTPRNQGNQAACVGWSSAYCALTVLHAQALGQEPDSIAFSPAFLYNQAKLRDCHSGTFVARGLDVLRDVGAIALNDYPYADTYCDRLPEATQVARAAKYRIADYLRLSTGTGSFAVNVLGIRQHLAQGLPVVFVLMVGSSFDHLGRRYVWKPTTPDAERLARYKAGQKGESGLSGHAMTLVGYDDEIAGGVFIVQNSWGTGWGIGGRCAIRYADFAQWCVEAYGLYLPSGARNGNRTAELSIGLRSTLERSFLLQGTGPYSFRSRDTLPVGEKFRLEVSNTRPCYMYALTLARSDSVIVLHPPDSTRSPRLATAGTRLIPTEDALVADYQGMEEELLVLASAEPLALDSLRAVWNQQPKYLSLLGRIANTMPGLVQIAEANLADGELVRCSLPLRPGSVLPVLIRLPK